METDEERKARLEKMVATKRLWRWMKKEKQDWRRWYTQLILALETEESRRARLEHLSDNQHIRLSAGAQDKKCVLFCLLHLLFLLSNVRTSKKCKEWAQDERAARLEHLSHNQYLRLSAETNDKRVARWAKLSDNQHLRLSTETDMSSLAFEWETFSSWASETSPTLDCSIMILHDIYIYTIVAVVTAMV